MDRVILKEKEYPLILLQYKAFVSISILKVQLRPCHYSRQLLPTDTFKQVRFLRYFILFTIIVLKYCATQRNSVTLKIGDQNERNCCECASDNTYHFYIDLNAEGVVYLFQVVSDDGFIHKGEFLNLKPSSRAAQSG